MIFIKHRVNSIRELRDLDPNWGAEIDLRSRDGHIHLAHDLSVQGEGFCAWLDEWKLSAGKGPLILNTKEDGLEPLAMRHLAERGITNYFFLDTTIPTLVRWLAAQHVKNFAVRMSSYEPPEFVNHFKGLAEWVWVDCFGAVPIDTRALDALGGSFKVCLVSPELQGGSEDQLKLFTRITPLATAICTKFPQSWQKILSEKAVA